jgi:hypothetical protein
MQTRDKSVVRMVDAARAGSIDDLGRATDRLRREAIAIAAQIDRVLDRLDALAKAIAELQKKLGAEMTLTMSRGRRRRSPEIPVLNAEAAAGVDRLEIVPMARGDYEVSVNGRAAIRLSAQLGAALAALAAPGHGPSDGLVGWKSKAELAAEIRERTGGKEEATDVPKIVHRLRMALRAAGENPELVRSHRCLGFRFALRVLEP